MMSILFISFDFKYLSSLAFCTFRLLMYISGLPLAKTVKLPLLPSTPGSKEITSLAVPTSFSMELRISTFNPPATALYCGNEPFTTTSLIDFTSSSKQMSTLLLLLLLFSGINLVSYPMLDTFNFNKFPLPLASKEKEPSFLVTVPAMKEESLALSNTTLAKGIGLFFVSITLPVTCWAWTNTTNCNNKQIRNICLIDIVS